MSRFMIERDGARIKVMIGPQLASPENVELRELLFAILDDGGKELVLDLSQTSFIDAAGIRVLLMASNSFSGDKSCKLVSVQRNIYTFLESLRLHQRLGAQMA
jgi:anti-anti-sigma factor